MVKTEQEKATESFVEKLEQHKAIIDARIDEFVVSFESSTAEQFGEYPLEAIKTFTSYLKRGGKRIRGSLTIVGYQLFGGKDEKMILEAALAIEMLQSYILMMDDIQDRSETRRGGPTAHMMLKDYHEKHHLRDDSLHFGESIAMSAFVIGCHAALDVIAALDTDPERVVRAIRNINRCYITTGHGQNLDIFNEVVPTIDEEDVHNVLLWKTAFYTFVNPLQLGAILAGATEKELDTLYQYSMPAGRAFQITDDILGVFGSEFESGKSPLDDIKEGKRTILSVKALEMAPKADVYYLERCLGNHELTMAEFKKCKEIIARSGALGYAQTTAENAVEEAISVLVQSSKKWNAEQVDFLIGLVRYLVNRKS